MTEPDEVQLGRLAKKVLAMPPKKRKESKVGASGRFSRDKPSSSAIPEKLIEEKEPNVQERHVIHHIDGAITVHEIRY